MKTFLCPNFQALNVAGVAEATDLKTETLRVSSCWASSLSVRGDILETKQHGQSHNRSEQQSSRILSHDRRGYFPMNSVPRTFERPHVPRRRCGVRAPDVQSSIESRSWPRSTSNLGMCRPNSRCATRSAPSAHIRMHPKFPCQ